MHKTIHATKNYTNKTGYTFSFVVNSANKIVDKYFILYTCSNLNSLAYVHILLLLFVQE